MPYGGLSKQHDAVTVTGVGPWINNGLPYSMFLLQVIYTGTPTRVVATIEGSLDEGTTAFTIGTWDTSGTPAKATGDAINASGFPCTSFRVNLTTITGGTSPTVTTRLAYDHGGGGVSNNSVTLSAGDIEIGAVEVKDGATDQRAKVLAPSTAPGATDPAIVVTIHPLSAGGGGAVTIADGADVAQGVTTGAKVVTDANGTIQQYLRGLVTFFANALGAGTAAAAHRTTLASDDPAVATLGATTGTKVVTDANGTLQQYLRGLVTFFANALGAGTAAAANRVTLASDDPGVAALGATTGTAVITDANGTIQQYLRGLVKLFITGVAGTASANVLTVQGILSGTPLTVGGTTALPTANFTRPADTTAYASGDLIANSTTAGSVVPLTCTLNRTASGAGSTGMLRRVRIRKSGTSTTNATFRVHLYTVNTMTFAGGDNAAWSTDKVANYVGALDVTMDKAFTDGASGNGVPNTGNEINLAQQVYYAVMEARAAYTPANAEVFTLEFEVLQN